MLSSLAYLSYADNSPAPAPNSDVAEAFADVLRANTRFVAPHLYDSASRQQRWLTRQWRDLSRSRGKTAD
jgi:hypothetical protein